MITLTHTKQAYAAYVEGSITREEYKDVVRHACPTPGACPFMGTARRCAPWRKFWALPRTTTPAPAASPKNGTSWRGRLPAGHVRLGA